MEDWSTDLNVPWYSCRSNINNVIINNGVTSIGWNAFHVCSNIVSINIPNSITDIGQEAFAACIKLTSIEIPNSVTIIRPFAFSGCSDLKSVELSNNINGIYSLTFSGCSSLTSIEIPDGVTEIHIGAFTDCTNLKSITIPNSITNIYDGAFSHESNNLNDIYYTGSKEQWNEIEIGADNEDLTKATIHYNYGNETIAFGECGADGDNLTWTLDKNGALIISGEGKMANWLSTKKAPWYSCRSNINNVIINNGVTSIGWNAFYDSKNLKTISVPNSVTAINTYAFEDCFVLTAIDVSENNERYSDINGVLFNKEKTQLIKCPASYASYVIPGHVTNIKDQAFRGCVNLISIEIPESVSIIYDATFYRCTNLTSIILHDNIMVIKASAFFNCSSLKSIKLPTNITKISAYTMGSCLSLESVYIPDTVTAIDDNAFYNCSKLKDIYYAGTKEEWYAITIGVSNECLTNATIHYNSSASTAQTLSLPRNKTASVPDSVQTYTYSNAVPDTKYLIMAVNDNETENMNRL